MDQPLGLSLSCMRMPVADGVNVARSQSRRLSRSQVLGKARGIRSKPHNPRHHDLGGNIHFSAMRSSSELTPNTSIFFEIDAMVTITIRA